MVPRFIPPCLPSPADRPPSGPGWIHEIKHDGFRMMVRGDPAGVVDPQRVRLDGALPADRRGRRRAQGAQCQDQVFGPRCVSYDA
jgi:hypothetical protein